MNLEYTYDIALSFAGEDRNVAREIADRLRAAGYTVFFGQLLHLNRFAKAARL